MKRFQRKKKKENKDINISNIIDSEIKGSSIRQGFSKGIHNVMEPSMAGIPIIFGPKYEHANEAHLLLKSKGAFCISNSLEFETTVVKLLSDDKFLQKSGDNSSKLVKENLGSSDKIVNYLIKD